MIGGRLEDRRVGRRRHEGRASTAAPEHSTGDRHPNKHTTVSRIYRILCHLAGRDDVEGKPKEPKRSRLRKDGAERKRSECTERRDLLEEAGIAWWSGHDVRRRLQSTPDLAGIPGGSSVVLAYEMKTSVDMNLSMTSSSGKTTCASGRLASPHRPMAGAFPKTEVRGGADLDGRPARRIRTPEGCAVSERRCWRNLVDVDMRERSGIMFVRR